MRRGLRWIWLPFAPALLLAGAASAISIDLVTVGNPGNASDPDLATDNCGLSNNQPCGSVASEFSIGKYEVTVSQYTEFLNSKAAADPFLLYDGGMAITRSGVSGSYTYSVNSGFANRPIASVSLYDAMRFSNWLHNGAGAGDTETGAYTLLGGTATPSNGTTVGRNVGALYFVPSENEWYKAAYYDAISMSYFDYPTGSNTSPLCSAPTATPNRENCGFAVGSSSNVGSYPGSPSPYGTFDQSGNVSEWTETRKGGLRGARGSAYNAGTSYDYAGTISNINEPYQNVNHGFRIGSVIPEPASGLLVGIGLLGLVAVRRR